MFNSLAMAASFLAIKIPVFVRNVGPFVAILVVWLALMAFVKRRG
jgi:hypothetical protein